MAPGHRAFVKKRTTWLFLLIAIAYAAVVVRLAWVQLLHNDIYHEWASRIRYREIPILANRGALCDRNGRPLAVSIQSASVFANRNEVKDVSQTAVKVAAVLGGEPRTLEERINGSGDSIVWLGLRVDPRLADTLDGSSGLRGVGVRRDFKRVYPSGSLAAQILGFTNLDNRGLEGMEARLDSLLTGRNGLMVAELDAGRRVIPETRHLVRSPEDGSEVRLTIDTAIQHIAEQALERMAQTYSPESACAVVLDAKTSEILALANYPTFDPNKPKSASARLWRNRAVADLYEPGSTLKIVTVAAALNEGLSADQIVTRCTGSEQISGGRIRCSLHHPFMSGHGAVDMRKTIQHSCNLAAAKLAFRLGARKLYQYEKAFGLLDRPNAGFGCEAVGATLPPDDWRPMRLANVGFGQGLAVTPLQMACAYATIANGGVYVEPRIVREVRNPDGSLRWAFRKGPSRRVISPEAARAAASMLQTCVEEGTGKTARIEGRSVAGKTGSAQIARPKGGYESGAFIASFMGFAPAGDPRIVIAVVVTRPKGSHWGATVAAPVFKEIGEKSLWYLKVPSDRPVEEQPETKPKQNTGSRQLA